MAKLNVVGSKRAKIGTVDVSADVFFAPINEGLIHQVLVAERAAWRQGTASTKTKGEVRGGGRKPFKQKGTGNARQGSIRSPLQPGGGETFGPRPRDYAQSTPSKMVNGAIRGVLSDRVKAERLLVVDALPTSGKTKELGAYLQTELQVNRVLIVDQDNEQLARAARNLKDVQLVKPEGVGVYDVLWSEWVVVTKTALNALSSRLEV